MLLKGENIYVSFKKENQIKIFGKEKQKVLQGISLEMAEGDCLGILGESGSGKSTLGRVIMGMLKPEKGNIMVDGKVSVVFQDYKSSVNPRFRVKDILEEPLILRKGDFSNREEKEAYKVDLLEQVGLTQEYLKRYPHELSGGQLQRVCIARAIAVQPKLILFDEAMSALDTFTQLSLMNMLLELKVRHNLSYVFISHDLTAVTYMCNKAAFIYEGRIAEFFESIEALENPKSSYARELMEASGEFFLCRRSS